MGLSIGREQADRLAERLQAFYDSLPEDEKIVLEAILDQAYSPEVSAYGLTGGVNPPVQVGVTIASRDVATGQATGKRQWGPITIVKEWGSAPPPT